MFLEFWRGPGAEAARGGRGGVYEAYTYAVPTPSGGVFNVQVCPLFHDLDLLFCAL
jgi:hypothetical protein